MMSKLKMIFTLMVPVALLTGCNQSANENSATDYFNRTEEAVTEEIPDSVANEADIRDSAVGGERIPLSSTAAEYKHPDKKFVRTADLSMDVKNVYQSTTRIENRIAELGGFVTKSNLESNVFSEETFPVSRDSAVEVRKYTVSNIMTVRIPESNLSAFLVSLGDEMEFLNYRNIEADDVSLKLLLSRMEQQRMKSTAGKLDDISVGNGKISDKRDIISNSDQKQAELNKEIVNELKIGDEIAYSTVSLKISEKEKVAETQVINLKDAGYKYRPGFWFSAGNSLKGGFELFQSILIGLLYLWPAFLLGGLIYLAFKQYRKTGKRISV